MDRVKDGRGFAEDRAAPVTVQEYKTATAVIFRVEHRLCHQMVQRACERFPFFDHDDPQRFAGFSVVFFLGQAYHEQFAHRLRVLSVDVAKRDAGEQHEFFELFLELFGKVLMGLRVDLPHLLQPLHEFFVIVSHRRFTPPPGKWRLLSACPLIPVPLPSASAMRILSMQTSSGRPPCLRSPRLFRPLPGLSPETSSS